MAHTDSEKEEEENYFADMNRYTGMAHAVAKMLYMRPNDILDDWCAPELIIAYGQYANEIADKNYREWKALSHETRVKVPRPERFFVQFIGIKDLWQTNE